MLTCLAYHATPEIVTPPPPSFCTHLSPTSSTCVYLLALALPSKKPLLDNLIGP
jgi:hypothetical protein